MSYILDALKKADHERDIGSIPGLGSEHGNGYAQHATPKSKGLWFVTTVVLLNILILMLLFFPFKRGEMPETRSGSVREPAVAIVRAPVAPSVPAKITPLPAVALRQAPVATPPASQPPASVKRRPVAAPPVSPPQASTPPQPVAMIPVPIPPASPPPVSVQQQPVPIRPEQSQPAAIEQLPVIEEIEEEEEEVEVEVDYPIWPQIPGHLLRKIKGALNMDVHVFSDIPESRFILVNLKKYYEGEKLEEGPVVEEITPDGMVVSIQGQQFKVLAK